MVPALRLVLELLFAFLAASLIVLTILRFAPWPQAANFPVLQVLEITFVCTVVVLTALRAVGSLWNRHNNREVDPHWIDLGQTRIEVPPPLQLDSKSGDHKVGAMV
ncbi:hypothetical protein B0H19DRAFT_1143487 [Mycena capillaripes]|nr:hypothetical protein B0H19DRAFT_1143487 [Mycena capillaripes]